MSKAVTMAAQGHTDKALEALDQNKKINFYQESAEARTALVEEFIQKNRNDFRDGMVLTNTSLDAEKINAEIRTKLQEQKIVEEKRR